MLTTFWTWEKGQKNCLLRWPNFLSINFASVGPWKIWSYGRRPLSWEVFSHLFSGWGTLKQPHKKSQSRHRISVASGYIHFMWEDAKTRISSKVVRRNHRDRRYSEPVSLCKYFILRTLRVVTRSSRVQLASCSCRMFQNFFGHAMKSCVVTTWSCHETISTALWVMSDKT